MFGIMRKVPDQEYLDWPCDDQLRRRGLSPEKVKLVKFKIRLILTFGKIGIVQQLRADTLPFRVRHAGWRLTDLLLSCQRGFNHVSPYDKYRIRCFLGGIALVAGVADDESLNHELITAKLPHLNITQVNITFKFLKA